MPQTQRVMVACSTIEIMIQYPTIRNMMMKISLPRICAAYMMGDAIILRAYKTRTAMIVANMNYSPSIVEDLTMMILYQQMHVVFVKIEVTMCSVRMNNRLKIIVNQNTMIMRMKEHYANMRPNLNVVIAMM